MTTKKAASWAQRHIDPARPWLLHKLGNLDIALLVRGEQAPNPDSTVTLTGETDATGMPRVALDWRLSDIDIRSVSVLVDALGHELQRLGLGTVEKANWMEEGQWKADHLNLSPPIRGLPPTETT